MIRGSLDDQQNLRVNVLAVMDQIYNEEAWIRRVQSTVAGVLADHQRSSREKPKIGLIGHNKDHSAYYPTRFPQWGSVEVADYCSLSATAIREQLFDPERGSITERLGAVDGPDGGILPENVKRDIVRFTESETFAALQAEYDFVRTYRKAWAAAPYPPTFVTVDAVVVQSGHVLLVERRGLPGRGQWALPGGFVDGEELIEDACIRELREETRLELPEPVLRGSVKRRGVYDHPYRSVRGRTITHAFLIELEPARDLPAVQGGDDARRAFWKPLAEIVPERMFEDHYFIIQNLIGA
jgi:bifunctional NMN adenylyltransferase/nudix hydrolase